jgi:TP901 family phage tail tape measure protein
MSDITFKVLLDTKNFDKNRKNIESGLKDISTALSFVAKASGAAFVALSAGTVFAINAAKDFERELVSVAAKTDLADKEIKELGDDLIKLSLNSQRAPIEFAKLAAIAGQLGVQGRENIAKFANEAVRISDALELDPTQVTTALAGISTVFNIAVDDVGRFGDAINVLSQTTKASADEIITNIELIAPTLAGIRFDERQLAGLAATFTTLVGEPRRAATSIRTFFTQAVTEFDLLADVTGKTRAELETLFNTDPSAFFIEVQRGLIGIESNAERAAVAAKIFGVDGTRAALTTSEQLEFLVKNLNDSVKAYEENISIQQELNRVNQSFSAQLNQLRGAFNGLLIEIGDNLLPIFTKLVSTLKGVIEFFINLPEPIKKATSFLLLGGAAVSGLIAAFATLGFIITSSIVPFNLLIKGLALFRGAAIGARVAAIALNTAILANPIGIVVAGITVAVAGLVFFFRNNLGAIKEIITTNIKSYIDLFKFLGNSIKRVIKGDFAGVKEEFNDLVDNQQQNADRIKEILKETVDANKKASDARKKAALAEKSAMQGVQRRTRAPVIPGIVTPQITPTPSGILDKGDSGKIDRDREREEELQSIRQSATERIQIAQELSNSLSAITQERDLLELTRLREKIALEQQLELERIEAKRNLLLEQGPIDLETIRQLEQEEQNIKAEAARQELERDRQLSLLKKDFLVKDLKTLKGFLGETAGAFKEAAIALKAIRLGEAIVNVAAAITSALAGPFPINIANAAIVGAKGAAEIATISAQLY